ncbi:MAG TPA: ATP-dependent helicase, partial [Bacteroidales bacterium]|nr:ATP-dependent helicase [Bacteroidales bacterium]
FVFEGYNCKLIFTGDTAQLPPVGLEYSPALDVDYLKSSFNLNITSHQLTEVVRQSKDSGILFNTTYLRQKITNNKISPPFFKTNNYDVFNITGYDLEEYLNESYSKYGLNNVIVICKTNKRALLFNNSIRNRILLKEEILTTGELLMVVKNNYFFLPKDSEAGFIANGDIIEITRIKKYIQIYGFDFVQATIKLIDYPEEKEIEVVIMINTLFSETASLTYNDYKTLYEAIALDYQNIKSKTEKTKKIRENIYLNALQVKYSYALTCHKTQGGQWKIVFIDQGYLNNEMINLEYLRWLYTAESRAINKLYFVNFKDEFFEK